MRNEKSGQLNGLLRVRSITQDDAHIFTMESQVEEEIVTLLKMVKEYYKVFEIEPEFYLSTRPENYMGEIATWDKAEDDLKQALAKENIKYELKEGDGAFYGPKIDIDMKDALGRKWQLATVQLDFQLPQRFELEYIAADGSKQTPVLIHAAIFGSLERFIGIFIEHTGGDLPTWLSPVQVMVIPVSEEKFGDYAKEVKEKLIATGVRAEVDATAEGLGKRIRNADKQKIPYMLVVGEKEMESQTVAVRPRGTKDQATISVNEFVEKIVTEIKDKK
jgi:threonyl-tRNA synthetase